MISFDAFRALNGSPIYLQILRYILDWPHKPVIVTVPQAEMPIMCEEEAVSQEEEGELYE